MLWCGVGNDTLSARAARWTGYGQGRVSALDVGRGIAILSVIYGHALAPWFMNTQVHFSEAAFLQWKFGASFMMPFFFFLSGAGWREDKSLATTFRQAIALVLITWLASAAYDAVKLVATLTGVIQAIGGHGIGVMDFLAGLVRMALIGDHYSFTALWFLVALAVVRVLAALVQRAGVGATVALAIVLLVATFASTQYGWRNFYQLQLIGVAFAFFLAGHASRDALAALERRPAAAYALLLTAGAGVVATFHLNEGCRWDVMAQCGAAWLNGGFGVSMIGGQFGNLPLFALTAFIGVWFAAALSIILARFGGVVAVKLDAWGRNSLNLLIVNCLFLHVGNVLIERFVAPRLPGDSLPFFVALFAVTLAANLFAADILARPLRALRSFASRLARRIVEAAQRARDAIVLTRRRRVSQGND